MTPAALTELLVRLRDDDGDVPHLITDNGFDVDRGAGETGPAPDARLASVAPSAGEGGS